MRSPVVEVVQPNPYTLAETIREGLRMGRHGATEFERASIALAFGALDALMDHAYGEGSSTTSSVPQDAATKEPA